MWIDAHKALMLFSDCAVESVRVCVVCKESRAMFANGLEHHCQKRDIELDPFTLHASCTFALALVTAKTLYHPATALVCAHLDDMTQCVFCVSLSFLLARVTAYRPSDVGETAC